ncbi:MAG: glycoside hydrolase family 15 protein [Candidatus Vogelbacteria bacterium]|nr:glycoside hydrolase family 15 protein [Candidatus Vogelbacteria bacterium]
MPRSIVLGNGHIAVGLDSRGLVRDFYFPFVGLENHVGGHLPHRVGVWVEGNFSWMGDGSWEISVESAPDALASLISAFHSGFGLSLLFRDTVYNEENIFLRSVEVVDHSGRDRHVRLFFGQEFEIYESHRGDTVYYDPLVHAIIHYNGKRVFLVNAISDVACFNDFTTGVFGIEGKEGSFRDAEDGILSRNLVEHGPTDSVIAVHLNIAAKKTAHAHYWIIAAKSTRDVCALDAYVLEKTPEHLRETTGNFWRAWVNRYPFRLYGLEDRVYTLFKKSMLIVRAHADNGGGIIASTDSSMFQGGGKDTYAYVWPRDAAISAMALDAAGDNTVARRYFEFAAETLTDGGYFMHKYRPDKSLGSSWHPWLQDGKVSLPIQEDETAIVLVALWKHYELTKDLEFVERLYNPFIKKIANFLMGYRDPYTGLPKQSYDLWEEKFGIHTYTAACVYGALIAAAKFAALLGKELSKQNYLHTAEEMRRALLRYLYDEKTGNFYKMVKWNKAGNLIPDQTLDLSSIASIVRFEVLPPEDPRVRRAMQNAEGSLSVRGVGGIARYAGDRYYCVDDACRSGSVPGNPWIITSLWLAQYYARIASKERDFKKVRELLSWVCDRALPSGVFPEQVHAGDGSPASATPLAWSHAEFVLTVLGYLDRIREIGICDDCNPVRRR